MYSGYGIAFDGKYEWNFGNVSASCVTIFGVDNSSSSHTDNCKNGFLVLSWGDAFHINRRFDTLEKKSSINYSINSVDQIYQLIIVIWLLTRKIRQFNAYNKNINFANQFCQRSIYRKHTFWGKNIFKRICTWFFSRLQCYW